MNISQFYDSIKPLYRVDKDSFPPDGLRIKLENENSTVSFTYVLSINEVWLTTGKDIVKYINIYDIEDFEKLAWNVYFNHIILPNFNVIKTETLMLPTKIEGFWNYDSINISKLSGDKLR